MGVSVVTRGVEIGLVHGFLLPGPFIKLGPLRTLEQGDALGCVAAAGLVVILTACLSIYGLATYQSDRLEPKVGVKTLSGRSTRRTPCTPPKAGRSSPPASPSVASPASSGASS